MIDFNNLGTEADLIKDYPRIDAFFEKYVKQHRIHVADNLALSVLELKAKLPRDKDAPEEDLDKPLRAPEEIPSTVLPVKESIPGTNIDDSSSTLVIIAGRGETEHKYAELLFHMRHTCLRVIVLFVRGQGQSSSVLYGSTKSHVEKFSDYVEDVTTCLNYLDVGPNYKILAFSLGGLIALNFYFTSNFEHKPKAMALIAPFMDINFPIKSKYLYPVLKLLCNIRSFAIAYTPHGREYKRIPFEENYHSHSEVRYNLYHDYYRDHPLLPLAGPTFKFVKCCLQAQRKIIKGRYDFNIPVLCISAGRDQVVNTNSCAKYFARHMRDPIPPRYEMVPHAYHDILNESDNYRNQALTKALDFLFNSDRPKEV